MQALLAELRAPNNKQTQRTWQVAALMSKILYLYATEINLLCFLPLKSEQDILPYLKQALLRFV